MRSGMLLGLAGLVTGVSLGCGGSGEGVGGGPACGGDIVGQWETTDSSCGQGALSVMASICPQAKITRSDVATTGSTAFNRDGTFSATATDVGSGTWSVPPPCVAAQGLTCDDFARFLTSFLDLVTGGLYSVDGCMARSDGGCDCALRVDGTVTVAGTYATRGSTLTVTPTSSSGVGLLTIMGSNDSYCVENRMLTITSVQNGATCTTVATMQ